MRDRRKRNGVVAWSTFFWCTLLIVFSSVLFTTLTFSSLRPFSFHPNAVYKWRNPAMEAKSGYSPATIAVRETVMLPDQALIFLNYPPSFRFYTKRDLHCVYFSADSSRPQLTEPPIQVHPARLHEQIVRCSLPPRGYNVSLQISSNGAVQARDSSIHNWDPLVYEALFDRDNTTIVFVKGLNLRPERLAEPSRFQCVYGWDFTKPKFLWKTDVVSVAQEIVRCRTPMGILTDQGQGQAHFVKVSVQVEGKGIFPSIARPGLRSHNPTNKKAHEICVCTMLRNQARFIKEWVMYHTRIGVQRWYIYDNNSDDDIDNVIEFLQNAGYNITQHLWPWVKTQEAGFAHCALRARASCEWVGFFDVDEFFNIKIKGGLHHVIWHHARPGSNVGEIRTPCYSFGPSGLKDVPRQGVMVGYTCRLVARERHKSIVRPEALNQSLINVVHHFHLSAPFVAVDVDYGVMVINHYKYQVWKVFKEKFYRRVATYVADWQEEQNVGSKDRVPGLGTKAVEPADWSNRFCEVRDMGLRNRVLRNFVDRRTRLLPWQPEFEHHIKKRRRRKEKRPLMI
ncbi:glycosyltransferase family 92 protein RCOM_0530710 [Gastrolobium bilobum]|uniref:glycosyltransferase family 92 protein RCOM_0530710 n=1 Tax=Gastrolobium bilobum TaxID=150636 RepID=UPI002AB00C6C|nr:glycosyltransferase family 92 protein RCOM_0530710 [Gastrolobium bilobum]